MPQSRTPGSRGRGRSRPAHPRGPCRAPRSAAPRCSLRRWSTRFRMRNMISVRFERDVARHAGNALGAPHGPRRRPRRRTRSRRSWPAGRSPGRRPGRCDRRCLRRACPPIQWVTRSTPASTSACGSMSWVIDGPPSRCPSGTFGRSDGAHDTPPPHPCRQRSHEHDERRSERASPPRRGDPRGSRHAR